MFLRIALPRFKDYFRISFYSQNPFFFLIAKKIKIKTGSFSLSLVHSLVFSFVRSLSCSLTTRSTFQSFVFFHFWRLFVCLVALFLLHKKPVFFSSPDSS